MEGEARAARPPSGWRVPRRVRERHGHRSRPLRRGHPPRRVVFTWGWEGSEFVPPGMSTVEIDLERVGSGTRLRLVHRGLPEAAITTHTEGWDYFLPRLIDVAEGREPEKETAHHTDENR
ncbi:MAG TPA: SRPBCC domain-containing protein [Candidatus Limnocylindria bacterium]|nr:SRPBCC domain-containing protein [Candidatus Limnocylindria bacterium]